MQKMLNIFPLFSASLNQLHTHTHIFISCKTSLFGTDTRDLDQASDRIQVGIQPDRPLAQKATLWHARLCKHTPHTTHGRYMLLSSEVCHISARRQGVGEEKHTWGLVGA